MLMEITDWEMVSRRLLHFFLQGSLFPRVAHQRVALALVAPPWRTLRLKILD